jgi:hypothetical protein
VDTAQYKVWFGAAGLLLSYNIIINDGSEVTQIFLVVLGYVNITKVYLMTSQKLREY